MRKVSATEDHHHSPHLDRWVLGQVVEGKGNRVGGGVDAGEEHVQRHDRRGPCVAASFWKFNTKFH